MKGTNKTFARLNRIKCPSSNAIPTNVENKLERSCKKHAVRKDSKTNSEMSTDRQEKCGKTEKHPVEAEESVPEWETTANATWSEYYTCSRVINIFVSTE